MMPYQPREAKLLLVEGREEVALFKELSNHLRITGVEIKDYGGKTQLGTFLKGLVRESEFRRLVKSLAITRDADRDAQGAWQSVVDACKRADLTPPSAPADAGEGKPRVRVLVLPGEHRPGMLEDVCLASIAGVPAMECVDGLFKCIEEKVERLPNNMSKARAYAYLSTLPTPGRRVGEVAGSGVWRYDDPAFEPLRNLLTQM